MTASNEIDLVQDVTADCSVVASLCAVVARVGNGLEQVGVLSPLQNDIAEVHISFFKRFSTLMTGSGIHQRSPGMENTYFVYILMVVFVRLPSMIVCLPLPLLGHSMSLIVEILGCYGQLYWRRHI
jgi:hypothetical protein